MGEPAGAVLDNLDIPAGGPQSFADLWKLASIIRAVRSSGWQLNLSAGCGDRRIGVNASVICSAQGQVAGCVCQSTVIDTLSSL
jgi:hypothetical protein